jgi:phosphoglycolate phosphatase
LSVRPQAVLFDLDGTLVDSAPDLAAAANAMRVARGMAPLDPGAYRAHCGSGARGMLRVAFDMQAGDPGYDACREEYLSRYAQVLLQDSALFERIPQLLRALEAARLPWGIVTNKSHALAAPLCQGLGLQPAVLVGGDTTAHRKPHPAPLMHACLALAVSPGDCLYVGDDPRDIEAGRAAGMRTVGVRWGYLGLERAIEHWGADALIDEPLQLLNCLKLA